MYNSMKNWNGNLLAKEIDSHFPNSVKKSNNKDVYIHPEKIFEVMRKPSWIFDSRNILDNKFLKNIGYKIWTLGTSK